MAARRIHGLDAGEREAARRRQLLDAALDLFVDRGFASTSVDLLCQRAGVSTKSFYVLYDGKEAVFLDLYEDLLARVGATLVARPEERGLDEAQRAAARTGALLHALLDDPRVGRLLVIEAPGLTPAIEARRRRANRDVAALIERMAVTRVARGTARPGDHRRGGLAIVGAITEILADWLLDEDPDRDPVDVLVAEVVAWIEVARRSIAIDPP